MLCTGRTSGYRLNCCSDIVTGTTLPWLQPRQGRPRPRDWDRELTYRRHTIRCADRKQCHEGGAPISTIGSRLTGRGFTRVGVVTWKPTRWPITDEQRLGAFVVDGSTALSKDLCQRVRSVQHRRGRQPLSKRPCHRKQMGASGMVRQPGRRVLLQQPFLRAWKPGRRDRRAEAGHPGCGPAATDERGTSHDGLGVPALRPPAWEPGSSRCSSCKERNGINLSGGLKTVNGQLMELYENRDQDSKGVEIDLRSPPLEEHDPTVSKLHRNDRANRSGET